MVNNKCRPLTSQLVALQEALCFQISVLNAFNQLASAFVAMHRASRAGRRNSSVGAPHPHGRLLQVCTKAKMLRAAILDRLVPRSACCASGWGGTYAALNASHHITSHHITSHHITSHHITSQYKHALQDPALSVNAAEPSCFGVRVTDSSVTGSSVTDYQQQYLCRPNATQANANNA